MIDQTVKKYTTMIQNGRAALWAGSVDEAECYLRRATEAQAQIYNVLDLSLNQLREEVNTYRDGRKLIDAP